MVFELPTLAQLWIIIVSVVNGKDGSFLLQFDLHIKSQGDFILLSFPVSHVVKSWPSKGN